LAQMAAGCKRQIKRHGMSKNSRLQSCHLLAFAFRPHRSSGTPPFALSGEMVSEVSKVPAMAAHRKLLLQTKIIAKRGRVRRAGAERAAVGLPPLGGGPRGGGPSLEEGLDADADEDDGC